LLIVPAALAPIANPEFESAKLSQTVGDFIVQRMHEWGVRRIFRYPGDGINGVFGALNRTPDKITFVQARHEEMAVFMASAYAKFSGELGVCIATSGNAEVFGRLSLCPRTITNGNPKGSRRAPRKAHFMNAETDRRA
jgi:hypothetical protein